MTTGRPKRNPVETLKTKVYMAYVCQHTKIQSGHRLEELFDEKRIVIKEDGTRQGSNKWKRFKKGIHTPSDSSRNQVYAQIGMQEQLEAVFNQPLWDAMEAGNFEPSHWMKFYQALPLNIQSTIFKSNTDSKQKLQLKKIRLSTINKLLKLWSNDAFACLVALSRDSSAETDFYASNELPFFISKYLQYLLKFTLYQKFSEEIWCYFQKYIIPNSKLADSEVWQNTYEYDMQVGDSMLWSVLLAEDVLGITSDKAKHSFLFWRLQGNLDLINHELFKLREKSDFNLYKGDDGLLWLIDKINQDLPKKEQIQLN